MNKTQTITGGDRGTHDGFIQNAKTPQYVWNSATIDDTDISRILEAIGGEFRFPLDVDICYLPYMNTSNNSAVLQYLRDVSTDSQFTTLVLQVLVEERCTRHREHHNSTITTTTSLKVGDIVKSHVHVQSKSESVIVNNLSYKAKGIFIITRLGPFQDVPYALILWYVSKIIYLS